MPAVAEKEKTTEKTISAAQAQAPSSETDSPAPRGSQFPDAQVELLMHPPRVGDVVFWYQACDPRPDFQIAAIVTFVHVNNMVNLSVFSAQETAGRRLSVPHISDVRLKNNPDMRRDGAWEYTPQTREHHELMVAIG